jgi:polyisoprenoid-binding protein YceI
VGLNLDAARRTQRLRPTAVAALICFILPLRLANALEPPPLSTIAVDLKPVATSIRWTLNTTLHTVHGSFKLKSGAFRVDPDTGETSGLIVIDATSAESGDSSRDKVMHRDVLESRRYPEITFRPTHVEGRIDLGAPGTVTVDGILNLGGKDHPMQLPVSVEMRGSDVHLTTQFKVPYVAWGRKDPSTFIFRAEKEVALDVDLSAPLKP